jgi:bacillithiol system protein YtxJ
VSTPEIARIESEKALDELFARSFERPVWVLKHSLVCPLSAEALREFGRFAATPTGSELRVLEIQRQRGLSQELARRTGVRHESPQAILVRDGKASWHASHWSITARALAAAEGEQASGGS